MKNYANIIEYERYLEQYNYIFDENYLKSQEEHILTDKIKLLVDNFNHSYYVTDNFGYSISCQTLQLFDKGERQIFSCKYAFGKLFYQYIRHSNENEYFISGNDLLEYSIYNITKNEEFKFISECRIDEDSEEDCDNEFWYIKKWIYNPKNNLVAINGQDGMNSKTVTLCEFTNPEIVPLKFKNLYKTIAAKGKYGICNAIGWTENNNLEIEVGEEQRVLINLTETEIVSLLNS